MTNTTPASTSRGPGRRAVISRDDLIAAALQLVGPNRSISTLSLREITRQAGVAPNSFYRHFKDVDELAVAAIELSGQTLRSIVGEARRQADIQRRGIVRLSVLSFMAQLENESQYLPLLLREGAVGSEAFCKAVHRQLEFFEEELADDLRRAWAGDQLDSPAANKAVLVAKAITRLVFALGGDALSMSSEEKAKLIAQLEGMIKMIIRGALSSMSSTSK